MKQTVIGYESNSLRASAPIPISIILRSNLGGTWPIPIASLPRGKARTSSPTWIGWVAKGLMGAAGLAVAGILTVLVLAAIALSVAYPNLPEIGGLMDYRPKLPMRDLFGRRDADRRIWRGAPQVRSDQGNPKGHEGGRPCDRGLALL